VAAKPSKRSSRIGAGSVLVLAIIIGFLAFSKAKHVKFTPSIGSGCLVRGRGFDVPLTSGQAGLAAVIAGVARHRAMPVRAVTIAYAAALQESDLADLPYGDRDSVGIFQQRPSQGWGSRQELLNPVYATTRFFRALAAVPGYRHLLVYQAAQDVQRSADGYAYSQYSGQGSVMAYGFTGTRPHDVWCWYGGGGPRGQRLAAADEQLRAAFGRLPIARAGDPLVRVRVGSVTAGWAVASWLVTHAYSFGIKDVSFQGYTWTAARGQKGWVRDAARPAAASGSPPAPGGSSPGGRSPGGSSPGGRSPGGRSPGGSSPGGSSPGGPVSRSPAGRGSAGRPGTGRHRTGGHAPPGRSGPAGLAVTFG